MASSSVLAGCVQDLPVNRTDGLNEHESTYASICESLNRGRKSRTENFLL